MSRKRVLSTFLLIGVSLLLSCGEYPGSDSSGSLTPSNEGTGGVTARLVFPGNTGADPSSMSAEALSADLSSEISTVLLYASKNGSVVVSASFAYTAHGGALMGIPTGGQYLIGARALDPDGNTRYHSSRSGIYIGREAVTNIGELYMIRKPFGFTDSGQALGTGGTYAMEFGDVDGDGDQDMVVGQSPSVLVRLNDGAGAFTDSGQVLGNGYPDAIALGDVDGDNDLDIVENADGIIWLNDGSGSFSDSRQVPGLGSSYSLVLGDVDEDGDLDLLEGYYNATYLYLNNGHSQGGTEGVFDYVGNIGGTGSARSIALGDVDGDGDLDLVVGNYGDPNQVFVNQGYAQAGSLGTFSYNQTLTGDTYTESIALGDIDGDGDLDLVEGDSIYYTRIWINSGNKQGGTEGWFANYQFMWVDRVNDLALGDVDNDGDLDLVISAIGDDGLYLNDGSGTFIDAGTFGIASANAVELADLDGNGFPDVGLGTSAEDIVLLDNAAGTFTDSGQSLGNYSTYALDVGDVDGDGDLDMVSGNWGPSVLWTNDGAGAFTSGQTLSTEMTECVDMGDVDGDGDLDVVEGSWVGLNILSVNDGAGAFSLVALYDMSSPYTESMEFGDLDLDGDLDIVWGIYGSDNRVLVNDGTGTFTDTVLSYMANVTRVVALGDLNGDGFPDMVEGNWGGPSYVWLNGGGDFYLFFGFGSAAVSSIALDDVDGDGDLDVALGTTTANSVWLNDGSGLLTSTGQSLGNDWTQAVALGDVDGDGDLDLLEANETGANRMWRNDGTGLFTDSGQSLWTGASFAGRLADLDSDGDLDLVIGNNGPNKVYFND